MRVRIKVRVRVRVGVRVSFRVGAGIRIRVRVRVRANMNIRDTVMDQIQGVEIEVMPGEMDEVTDVQELGSRQRSDFSSLI